MPVDCICLLNPTSHASLDDSTTIGLEVQLVMLNFDPEAAFLLACDAADMESLIPKTELAIQDSKLYELPNRIGELAALQRLTLVHNKIRSLPEAIGQLTMLTILKLNANRLSSLPETIDQLAHLQELDVQNNPLKKRPKPRCFCSVFV